MYLVAFTCVSDDTHSGYSPRKVKYLYSGYSHLTLRFRMWFTPWFISGLSGVGSLGLDDLTWQRTSEFGGGLGR